MSPSRITSTTRERARSLRRNMTDAEQRLWRGLRGMNRLKLSHFRRQAPIGPYIADFADHGRRLIIEADGGQHNGSTGDARRDDWFKTQGFTVMRFWNNEIMSNLNGVLETIRVALAATPPPPAPPHKGEGGAIGAVGALAGNGEPK